MEILHLYAAWTGIFLGFLAGMVLGLFFQDENWLGGYSSWRRRMARLGHISFFGIAFINLACAVSLSMLNITLATPISTYLFITGAVTMPLVCFLSAYRKNFRHLFFVPVVSLVAGTIIFFTQGVLS